MNLDILLKLNDMEESFYTYIERWIGIVQGVVGRGPELGLVDGADKEEVELNRIGV